MLVSLGSSLSSSEPLLRRALFEDTGGMYPELITRPDVKVFLPPIGNLTVYICTCDVLTVDDHLLYSSRKSCLHV